MRTSFILHSFSLIFLFIAQGKSQDTLRFNLEEVLSLAIEQSIDLSIAQSETAEQEAAFENANLAFQPQLFLGATLPNLNRSIESRPLPDGSDAFVNRSTMYNRLGLDLNYQFEKTGGILSLSSTIERLDVFESTQFDYQRTYFVNPINLQYTQPLFTFNERRWQKERLSLLYQEFKERYARTREDIIIQAIVLFKNVFLSYEKVKLARRQIVETDSLLAIKNRLFEMGQATRAEMLRLRLDQNNNRQTEQSELLNWQQAQMELLDFLGLNRSQVILLEEPTPFERVSIPMDRAMALAISNPYITTSQRRAIVEAEAELERAQKDKDIAFDLSLSLGLNNTDASLRNLFNPLLDREIFTAGIRLPLTGWQKYKLRQQMATEQIKQERLRQNKERIDLSREAFNLVSDFQFLRQNLTNQIETRAVANEILQITRNQFLLGNATYAELNISNQERERATLDYYDTLLAIIEQYYQIRKLCMYDFVSDQALSNE